MGSHSLGPAGGGKSVDVLLKESEAALKRIEDLENKKRIQSSLSWIQRSKQHISRHSHHLVNLALATGLLGLSLARYQEKYSHRRTVEDLEEQVKCLEEKLDTYRLEVESGNAFVTTVRHVLASKGAWGIKSALQDALDSHGVKKEDEMKPEELVLGSDGSMSATTGRSSNIKSHLLEGNNPKPFI